MDENRQRWNQAPQRLRRALSAAEEGRATGLFPTRHAMVHSQQMSGAECWSFEDDEQACRRYAPAFYSRELEQEARSYCASFGQCHGLPQHRGAQRQTRHHYVAGVSPIRGAQDAPDRAENQTRGATKQVSEGRLKRVMDKGALLPEAVGVLNYGASARLPDRR